MKPTSTFLSGILACTMGWPLVHLQARGIPVDGYAAVVDTKVITIGEVLDFVVPFEKKLREEYAPGPELQSKLEKIFEMGLNLLIEQSLILQSFDKKEGDIPDKMVDDQIEKQIAVKFDNDRAAFQQWLEEDKKVSLNAYRKQVKDDLTVMILRRREIMNKVNITPSDVRKYYEDHKEEFIEPETVKVSMIVIKQGDTEESAVLAENKAKIILNRLKSGDNFEGLARTHSHGAKASEGGVYDWNKPSYYHNIIAEAIEGLAENEITPILAVGKSYYLVKLNERRKSASVSFEQLKDNIERKIRQTEEERLYKAWIERLKKNHYIKIF